jgi:hypothetical protein
VQCGKDATGPQPDPVIRILSPKDGARFQATDTVKIITESDYDEFSSNLSFEASLDSGRSWDVFILSLSERSGKDVKDTGPWVPADGGVAPGQAVKLHVYEYGMKYHAYTGFIHID